MPKQPLESFLLIGTILAMMRMENDAIADMSPGNKALVLLRLLISLAENKNPILIDHLKMI